MHPRIWQRIVAGAVLALGTTGAQGWVEVIPPEQVAAEHATLPAAAQQTKNPALAEHLRQVHQRYQSAGTQADTALNRQVVNAARVAADLAGADAPADAFFAHYVVPPLSPVMRLADMFPIDGRFGGTVGIITAQDEYEPGSFVIYPLADLDRVELKLSALNSADGTAFPADQLDLKVVKIWYQNGNGWFSYFSDVGLALVPELLLHDENLIRVDTETQSNHARVKTDEGETYVWISAPRQIDVPFDPYTPGFVDADTLQPVALKAGQFKQFILTAHATADTRPGVYRGQIEVVAAGRPTGTIPVAVKVLPFALPQPKALNGDDFIVTLMGAWPRVAIDHPAFMPTLRNLRQHNILHLGPNVGPDTPKDLAAKTVAAMKEAGFSTDFIINGGLPWRGTHDGTPYTYDDLMAFKRSAEAWRAFYLEHFGHTNAAIGLGDEQGAAWVTKARAAWRILNEHGLKSNLAGHEHIFVKGGHMLDVHPTAGSPSDAHQARKWNAVGHAHVGFYASQHNGSENPAYVRRQHGLLGYLSGFNMVNNYEFAYGPWNDRAYELYKPMVLAYPISNGIVDTLEWEGFREGIDDIRYATLLMQLAQEAIDSGNLDRIYAGRQVRQWLALMDGMSVDLHTVRLEMIEKIERLMEMAPRQ